jgi:hypothetical protein
MYSGPYLFWRELWTYLDGPRISKYCRTANRRIEIEKDFDQNPARTRTTLEYMDIAGFPSLIFLDQKPNISGWSQNYLLHSFMFFSKWYNVFLRFVVPHFSGHQSRYISTNSVQLYLGGCPDIDGRLSRGLVYLDV